MKRMSRITACAVGGTLAVTLVAALGVVPSSANWGDAEYDHAAVSALDCSANTAFDTTAWARMVSGSLGAGSLDGVAAIKGITTVNSAPSTTSVSSGASPRTDLGSDAWSSPVDLSALSTVDVGAGVPLPFAANTGVYSQYGRATASGLSIGAAGAVTSATGGLVTLDTPTAGTPTAGELLLSGAVSSAISAELGADAARLSDLGMGVGAVGSMATLDACGAEWSARGDQAAYVARDYLLSSLGLNLRSSVLGDVQSALGSGVTGLGGTLNSILAPNSSVTGAALSTAQTSLNSVLGSLKILGIQLAGGGITSLNAGVVFDLSPVTALLAQPIGSGSVQLNLATGEVSANLASANGLVGLNDLPANSPLLTPATVTALASDAAAAVTGFLAGGFTDAIADVVKKATVTVDVQAKVKAAGLEVLGLTIKLTGTLGAFTGAAGYGVVTPVITLSPSGLLGIVLGLVNQADFLNGVIAGLTGPLLSSFVPTLAGALLNGVLGTAQAQATAAVSTLSSTTLPPILALLSPVFTLLQRIVSVTVNAQPDKPDAVGVPDSSAPGTYFISALKVGAVNPANSSSLLGLYLASSSVGPNTIRP